MHQTQGALAEAKVCIHLRKLGHVVIQQNWRTRTAEIDIISRQGCTLYFTEVKYRRTDAYGDACEYVTSKKLSQMRFAARQYIATSPKNARFNKSLLVAGVSGLDFRVELLEAD